MADENKSFYTFLWSVQAYFEMKDGDYAETEFLVAALDIGKVIAIVSEWRPDFMITSVKELEDIEWLLVRGEDGKVFPLIQ